MSLHVTSEDFSATELQRSGYDIEHMRQAGIPVRQILTADVSALEMRRCGFTASELRKAWNVIVIEATSVL